MLKPGLESSVIPPNKKIKKLTILKVFIIQKSSVRTFLILYRYSKRYQIISWKFLLITFKNYCLCQRVLLIILSFVFMNFKNRSYKYEHNLFVLTCLRGTYLNPLMNLEFVSFYFSFIDFKVENRLDDLFFRLLLLLV